MVSFQFSSSFRKKVTPRNFSFHPLTKHSLLQPLHLASPTIKIRIQFHNQITTIDVTYRNLGERAEPSGREAVTRRLPRWRRRISPGYYGTNREEAGDTSATVGARGQDEREGRLAQGDCFTSRRQVATGETNRVFVLHGFRMVFESIVYKNKGKPYDV